ncbi:MAG TPA: hypothetical protein VKX17_21965 [Planctomycetota bacterium]|nr:hypothetical protein [Planctomycetota bacterium]
MPAPNLVYICEICQTILQEHHCKAICPNCGRMFDCSDLPIMLANATIDEDTAELTMRPGSDPRDWLPKGEPESALENPEPGKNDEAAKDLP